MGACAAHRGCVLLAALLGTACNTRSETALLDPKPSGGYAVTGLDATSHRPILIYDYGFIMIEPPVWKDSYEGLPAMTVYEDGLVVRAVPEGTTTGHIDDPVGLARRIAASFVGLAPRIEASGATDQPMPAIEVRVGDTWRSVTVVGLHWDDHVDSPSAAVPVAFFDALRTVRQLALIDERPLPRTDFTVEMHDNTRSAPAVPWPRDIPPPPPFEGDPRYLLNPRSYALPGPAGAALHAFAAAAQGEPVATPTGERVSLVVRVAIPDEAYMHRVSRCAPSTVEPYQVCDGR
jgi:hypothetical protein